MKVQLRFTVVGSASGPNTDYAVIKRMSPLIAVRPLTLTMNHSETRRHEVRMRPNEKAVSCPSTAAHREQPRALHTPSRTYHARHSHISSASNGRKSVQRMPARYASRVAIDFPARKQRQRKGGLLLSLGARRQPGNAAAGSRRPRGRCVKCECGDQRDLVQCMMLCSVNMQVETHDRTLRCCLPGPSEVL